MAKLSIDSSRLAALLTESDVAVIAVDTEGLVTEWSGAAEPLFGWAEDEMLGQPLAALWPDENRAADVQVYEDAMRGEAPHFRAWRRRRDGSHFLAEISTSLLRDGDDLIGSVALVRDITAAAAGAADLHRLLNTSNLAIIGIDQHHNIRSWGGAAEELHGWTADEIIGLPITMLWADADGGAHSRAMTVTDAGESTVFRAWRRRKDGSRFLAELTASPTTADDGWVGSVSVSRDVTAEYALSRRLEAAERRFEAAFSGAALPLVICQLDGTIAEANTAYRSLSEDLEIESERLLDLIAPMHRPPLAAALRELGVRHDQVEPIEVAAAGDARRTLAISIAPVDEGQDAPPLALVQISDVSEYRRIQAELAATATTDALTGAYNRSFFGPYLDSLEPNQPLALLFVDLDAFKSINDTLGHRAGDLVLITIVERLHQINAEHSAVVRFGGDEFVVVCPGIDDPDAAQERADEIRRVVAEPIGIDETAVAVTASVGVALVTTGPHLCADDAVRAADGAMYAAKAKGRDATAIAALP